MGVVVGGIYGCGSGYGCKEVYIYIFDHSITIILLIPI